MQFSGNPKGEATAATKNTLLRNIAFPGHCKVRDESLGAASHMADHSVKRARAFAHARSFLSSALDARFSECRDGIDGRDLLLSFLILFPVKKVPPFVPPRTESISLAEKCVDATYQVD